ncbi:hypothetical protein H0H92_002042 [Tricholoma furcatifolium]|nr:hypothetical protein H0H92_002042 [Tricholoma furcatifolium]
MMTNDFVQIVVPQPPQITFNPTARPCIEDDFNFPTFRLLNKLDRVKLSTQSYEEKPDIYYGFFAVSNLKGWFAALSLQENGSYLLVASPLADLRAAFKNTKETFIPQRTSPLNGQNPTNISLACNDTRLFVVFEAGELLVFDTAALFTPGSDPVTPTHAQPSTTGPIRYVAPNPGPEPGHADLFAVVHSNRTVVLYNGKLEVQGGWISTQPDPKHTPVAVSWSPKGKHIAIGLQSGDILTYALTNQSQISKHMPPTNPSPLVSLDWLSPGHTFRTFYAGPETEDVQHIVCIDAKIPTASYFSPPAPFYLSGRTNQSFIVTLPKWDEREGAPATESTSLVVTADLASVDFEIIGSIGTQWAHFSQENPITLPVNFYKSEEDTLLLALAVDLTDAQGGEPILYAYLNDGTVQAWYMQSPKPYPGMKTPGAVAAVSTTAPSDSAQPPAPAPPAPSALTPAPSAFASSSAFGQTSTPTSAFGAPSAFGQPQTTSVFGKPSGFGAQPTPTFGSSGFGQPATTSAFGQTSALGQATSSPVFGQTSAPSPFGPSSSSSSAFGTPSGFGQTSQPAGGAFANLQSQPSPFGQAANPSVFGTSSGAFEGASSGAFGSFGGGSTTNAFGGPSFGNAAPTTTTSAVGGGGAFGSFANNSSTVHNAFGQGSFGTPSSTSGSTPAPTTDTSESREESMADDTPSLGGIGLGAPNDPSKPAPTGGIFGSFGPSASSQSEPTSSAFGGLIKPASGAFSNFASTTAATSNEQKPAESNMIKPASGFGQPSTFGQQPGFGQPGFGQQPAFGQSSFGKPPSSTSTSTAFGGGFGAFANAGTTSLAAAAQQTAAPASGGFAAFASNTSPFASAAAAAPSAGSFASLASQPSAPRAASAPAASAFPAPSEKPTSPFAPSGSGTSAAPAFGAPAFGGSPFGPQPGAPAKSPFGPQPGAPAKSPFEADKKEETSTSSLFKTPSKPAALAGSPPSSPDTTPRLAKASILADNESPPPTANVNATTTPTTSPFGKAPATGAFANLVSTPSVFKPATGFGAFGSDKAPSSSPFFNTEPKTPPTASAFANALSTTPASAGPSSTSALPAFGATSTLGARSAFSSTPTVSPPAPKAPATGGFGAFSGPSSGFAAFAGPKKSFNELLKVGDDDTTDSAKPSAKPVVSAFPPLDKTAPLPVFTPPPKETEKKAQPLSTPPRDKGKKTEKSELSGEPSFSNLSSLSDASSFAEVSYDDSEDNDVRSESDEAEGDEDEEPFLSDDLEEGEVDEEEEEEDEEEEEEASDDRLLSDVPEEDEDLTTGSFKVKEPVVDEAAVPLPASRPDSVTPQPEVPTLKITPSPPPVPEPSLQKTPGTTTPPGTPSKELATPAPVAPTPSTPFGLGLGRPSTRPTRSSPLTTSPVSHGDEDEVPSSTAKSSVSPQPPLAALPVKDGSTEDEDGKVSRPKTPPLLSAFGALKSNVTPPIAPASAPPTVPVSASTPAKPVTTAVKPPFSLFGSAPATPLDAGKPSSPLGSAVTPSPTPISAFGNLKPVSDNTTLAQPSSASSFFSTPPGFGIKGKAEASATPVLGLGAAPSTPTSFFGTSFTLPGASDKGKEKPAMTSIQAPPASTPPPLDFSGLSFKGKGTTAAGPSASAAGPSPAVPAVLTPPKVPVDVPTEAGMQRECMLVYNAVNEDLAALGVLAQHRMKGLQITAAKSAMPRTRADLANVREWSPASSVQLGKVLVQFEKDFDELRDLQVSQRAKVKELQSNILKAKTRKEEISRFGKAKDDQEFAKMLKARSLGPEHLETQAQLRRAIRMIKDRVQTLEEHLKGSKKKLTQVKTGRASIRPPTLDSINRTYRNIDLALNQQTAQLALLQKRYAKSRSRSSLRSSNEPSPSSDPERDPRLPSPQARPRSAVTPDVAVTTAAALNAERAAHRLKRALLQTRTAPLLNTAAVQAPAPPLSFNTPQKAQETKPAWSAPERRGATSAKKHGVIPFVRKTDTSGPAAGVGSGSPPVAFDWGPLPTFDYQTKGQNSFTMVEAVKLTPPRQ